MNIAVIGTGNVGSALARSFVRAGHNVTLAGRDAEKTRRVAEEVGAHAAERLEDVARDADVVVLAVWYANEAEVADAIRPVVAGKVVIEVSNPITPDYAGLATAGGPSAAEQLAERLPDARVVKAFNTVFASVGAEPATFGDRVDALFATDDDEARGTVRERVASIGLRPIDVGPLRMARYLEALHVINVGLNASNGWSWNTAFKVIGAPIPEPQGAREPVGTGAEPRSG